VHTRSLEIPQPQTSSFDLERWFWIVIRIACGVVVCVGHVLPAGNVVMSPMLLGQIVATFAIPVLFAVLLGWGNWAKASRWFLGGALLEVVFGLMRSMVSRIHYR